MQAVVTGQQPSRLVLPHSVTMKWCDKDGGRLSSTSIQDLQGGRILWRLNRTPLASQGLHKRQVRRALARRRACDEAAEGLGGGGAATAATVAAAKGKTVLRGLVIRPVEEVAHVWAIITARMRGARPGRAQMSGRKRRRGVRAGQ